jgi:hypothetical protein
MRTLSYAPPISRKIRQSLFLHLKRRWNINSISPGNLAYLFFFLNHTELETICHYFVSKSSNVYISFFSMSFLPQASKLIGLYESDSKKSILGFTIGKTFVRCQLYGTTLVARASIVFLTKYVKSFLQVVRNLTTFRFKDQLSKIWIVTSSGFFFWKCQIFMLQANLSRSMDDAQFITNDALT